MKAISRSAARTLHHMGATLDTLCTVRLGTQRIIDELRSLRTLIATGLCFGGVAIQTPDVQGEPTLPPSPPRIPTDESKVVSSNEEALVEWTERRLDLSRLTQFASEFPRERIGVFNTRYQRLMSQVNRHATLVAHHGTGPQQRQRSVEIVIDAVEQIYELVEALAQEHADNGGGNPKFSAWAHHKLVEIATEASAWKAKRDSTPRAT